MGLRAPLFKHQVVDRALVNTKGKRRTLLPKPKLPSAYVEDSVLSFRCQNQVEALAIDEVPVINQQELILWVVLGRI